MVDRQEEIPRYPALAQCLLIDARYSSRSEIIKDLRASDLFENIIEADSIGHGLSIIQRQSVDACFIGPSVTPAGAHEFLLRARKESLATDCAFVGIVDAGTDAQPLLEGGAHGVLEKPLSKAKFFGGVVRAIVRANEGGAWAKIYAETRGAGLEPEQAQKIAPPSRPNRLPTQLESAMSTALIEASAYLRDVVRGIERGEFALDVSGAPTKKSLAALHELVERVLHDESKLDAATAEFKRFFEQALVSWFVNLHSMDEKQATDQLRRALGSFVPTAGQ